MEYIVLLRYFCFIIVFLESYMKNMGSLNEVYEMFKFGGYRLVGWVIIC